MDAVNEESSSKTEEKTCQICKKKRKIPGIKPQRKANTVGKLEPRAKKDKKSSETAPESDEGNRTREEEDQSKVYPWMNISRTNDNKHVQSQGKRFILSTNILDHSCKSDHTLSNQKRLKCHKKLHE